MFFGISFWFVSKAVTNVSEQCFFLHFLIPQINILATATVTTYFDGVKLLPYHVQIEQRSDWHHQFKITVSTEKAKVLGGDKTASESEVIDNAIVYVGEIVEITIERPAGTFNFKGYVTDVQIDQTYAGDSFIIFKGFSPTYLLDGQKSVASYEDQTLEAIFNDVMSNFPANTAKNVNPIYTDPIPYVVRYKETQYQFLSRLAATYGEWFYYDGEQIIFGDLPSSPPKVELNFGSDSMLSFNYGINIRPSSFKQQFYKYQDNAPVEQSVADYKPGWLDSHSKTSLDTSNELFPEEGLDPVTHAIIDSNHIKHLAEAKKSSILSDTMLFTGQSADPRVIVGAEIEVSSRKGFIGNYRVISVTHSFSPNRDYINMFRAIPATSMSPPANRNVVTPKAEAQVGVVTDNNDPDKLGRVKVKLKWQEGNTPWIRVLTNHAGEDRGQGIYGNYFIPENGDEVIVDFEQGNPARPYILGSLYHGSIPPEFADAENNLKAIKTRSGHILKFDDTAGAESILITDMNENLIHIDTANNNITITAGANMTLNSTNMQVNVEETMEITANNLIVKTKENIEVLAKGNIDTASEGDTSILSEGDTSLQASGDTTISSDGAVTIEATTDATLKGQNAIVEGQIGAELKGTQAKVQGKATALLQGASGKIDVV